MGDMMPYMLANLEKENFEELVATLKKFGASEIVLTEGGLVRPPEKMAEALKKAIRDFDEYGIDVTFWFAPTIHAHGFNFQGESQKMIDIDGNAKDTFCPLDTRHAEYYCECVKTILSSGVKRVMFEDDMRVHFPFDKKCCFCDKHLALYSELLGEMVTIEKMREELSKEEPNRYRDAWIDANQIALETFAKALRRAADEVDENIQLVFCSGPSEWGGDGTNALKLIDILSGKTVKETRLIGAPYWGSMFDGYMYNMLSAVDYIRHQAHICHKLGVKTIAECDPYPRPRHYCPASHSETYHTIMLADGNFDRIMNYGLDYSSSVNYEQGYAEATHDNLPIYEEIKRIFDGKEAVGIHLVEPFDIVRHTHKLSETPEMEVIISASREFIEANSLSVSFEPTGANLIFGENARSIDRAILKNGSIIDISAAKILEEMGIDVNLASAKPMDANNYLVNGDIYEYFCDEDEKTSINGDLKEIKLKKDIELLSELYIQGKPHPLSYLYENEQGERFLVLGFDAKESKNGHGTFRNYCRQRQIIKYHEWLTGKKLDAVCLGNPDLYTMVKKDEKSLAVGLWNFFGDKIKKPVIELSEEYKTAEFINCSGKLEGNKVILDGPLYAYEFCFVHLKK